LAVQPDSNGDLNMNQWIDWTAVWEIVVVGLLAGAGLPALFAVGIRALGRPGRGHLRPVDRDELVGGNPVAIAFAGLCFAIVLAAVGYGIFIIVASGHK
jgi:hypothetical protein